MQKIKNFIGENKSDIICLIIITLYFLLLNCLYGNHISNPLIDIGHEAYFPKEMLEGKVLYKDIFNVYGPLAYQTNVIFYKIFGSNLNTLRLVGSLNSFVIVYFLYFISRLFIPKHISFIFVMFIITSCVFSQWEVNYIFPYSYPIVYAYSTFLASLFCLLLHKKVLKPILIPLSWFFVGLSLDFKYDYIPYAFVLMFYTIFLIKTKSISNKTVFLSFIAFIAPALLSLTVLFFQGVSLNILLLRIYEIKKYVFTPAQQYFYYCATGLYPNLGHFIYTLQSFKHYFLGYFLIALTGYELLSFLKEKTIGKFCVFFALGVATYVFFKNWFSLNFFYSLLWLVYIVLLIFIIQIVKAFKNRNIYPSGFLLLIVCSLISAIKSIFFLPFSSYGIFAIPLLFLCFTIFTVECLPSKIKNLDKKLTQSSFLMVVVFLIFTNLYVDYILSKDATLLNAEKKIYVNNAHVNYDIGLSEPFFKNRSLSLVLNETINYINNNTDKNASLWVIPEGAIINFLTNRPLNPLFDTIIPPYFQTYGDSQIVSALLKTPPDYILITYRKSPEYNYAYLCKDYGVETCNYIKSKYKQDMEFSHYFNEHDFYNMIIYKKTD